MEEKTRGQRYYAQNKEKVKANVRKHRIRRPDLQKIYTRTKNFNLKHLIIEHYGSKCEICGESHIECLTIDHKNGDGVKFRERMDGRQFSGNKFYRWLKKEEFPDDLGLRVLCFNCNCSIGAYGYSPYE